LKIENKECANDLINNIYFNLRPTVQKNGFDESGITSTISSGKRVFDV
jgi:hypothetical protein